MKDPVYHICAFLAAILVLVATIVLSPLLILFALWSFAAGISAARKKPGTASIWKDRFKLWSTAAVIVASCSVAMAANPPKIKIHQLTQTTNLDFDDFVLVQTNLNGVQYTRLISAADFVRSLGLGTNGSGGGSASNAIANINGQGTNATIRGLNLPTLTVLRATIVDASGNLTNSAVTSTELGFLSGVTSLIQTQLNAKQTGDFVLSNLVGVAGKNVTNGNPFQFAITSGTITATNGFRVTNALAYSPTLSGHWTNDGLKHYQGAYIEPRWTNMGVRPVLVTSNDMAILTVRTDGGRRILYFSGLNNPSTDFDSAEFQFFGLADGNLNGNLGINFNDNAGWFFYENRLKNILNYNILSNVATTLDPLVLGDTNVTTVSQGKIASVIGTAGVGIGGNLIITNFISVKGKATNENDLTVRNVISVIGTNSSLPAIAVTAHSNGYPTLLMRKRRDIEAAPTKVLAGDRLGVLEVDGYTGTSDNGAFQIIPEAITDFGTFTAETLVMFKVGNNSANPTAVWGLSPYNWTNYVRAFFKSNVTVNAGLILPNVTADRVIQVNASGDVTNTPLRIASAFTSLTDGQGLVYNLAMDRWTNGNVAGGSGSGEVNVNGEAAITNATRIGSVYGKAGITNLLRAHEGGYGISLTNQGGTNIQFAVQQIFQAGNIVLTNLVGTGAITNLTGTLAITNVVDNQTNGTQIGLVRAIGQQTLTNKTMTAAATMSITNQGTNIIFARGALTGDVTANAGDTATTIAANSVTYAKMQDISSTQRVLARTSAGAGDPQEAGITTLLDWIYATRGGILFRDGNNWTNLAPGTSGQFLASGGAGADVSWVTPGVLSDGDKGDILVSASGGSWIIDAGVVSNSKFRDSQGLSVVGRAGNTLGSVADIIASADGQTIRRSGTTVGFGALDLTSPNAISGITPRVNLPTQVPYEDEANTYTFEQRFTGPFSTTASNIVGTDIDWGQANFRKKTLTAHTVFTFSNLADDRWVRVKITQDGTGGWTNNWPAGIKWINSTNQTDTPLVANAANAVTYMTFHRENGTIYGWQSGPDSMALVDLANIAGYVKGDLLVWSGSHLQRQNVGADGTYLQADSASSNGVKWVSTGAGIVQFGTNNVTVGNQTNLTFWAVNGAVYATNNSGANKVDVTIVGSTNQPVEATGVQLLTNQLIYTAQEFNGSNGVTASTLAANWDMSLNTFKPVTNYIGTNLSFTISNVIKSASLYSAFVGLGTVSSGYSNTIAVGAVSGVNIRWMNWATNGNYDILVRPGYSYTLQMFADRATNVHAWVSTDDPFNPLSVVNFTAFNIGASNLVATNASVRAGASGSNAVVGGTMFFSTSSFTNLTSTFTNIASYTVPAHTMTNNGDMIIGEWRGKLLAGTNAINVGFGSQTNILSVSITNLPTTYQAIAYVTRTGNTGQHIDGLIQFSSGTTPFQSTNFNAEITETNGIGTAFFLQSAQSGGLRPGSLTNNYVRIKYDPASR